MHSGLAAIMFGSWGITLCRTTHIHRTVVMHGAVCGMHCLVYNTSIGTMPVFYVYVCMLSVTRSVWGCPVQHSVVHGMELRF